MNINITPVNFNGKYRIPRFVTGNSPKERPLLNNEVVDLVKEFSVTSVFHDKGIDLTNPAKKFLDAIKARGIKFFEIKE